MKGKGGPSTGRLVKLCLPLTILFRPSAAAKRLKLMLEEINPKAASVEDAGGVLQGLHISEQTSQGGQVEWAHPSSLRVIRLGNGQAGPNQNGSLRNLAAVS